MRKKNYVCDVCGSDNQYLMFQGEVWWDEVDQVWEVESVDDVEAFCTDCEKNVIPSETFIVEEDKQGTLDFGEYDGTKIEPTLTNL